MTAEKPQIEIAEGWRPGAIGRIAELHSTYYSREAGFGLFFEAKVATEFSRFLEGYDEARDRLTLALADGRVEGSIAIDGSRAAEQGAHLRWFIVSDELRGQGVGQLLIESAIGFCRERGYESVYLWTFRGLEAARHVYERNGFALAEQHAGTQWGREVEEQRYELRPM
jgi:GNAT superfamily N-acetyltransferase